MPTPLRLLAEAERQYEARFEGHMQPVVEPVPHTEENVMGFYWEGDKQIPIWEDNVPYDI